MLSCGQTNDKNDLALVETSINTSFTESVGKKLIVKTFALKNLVKVDKSEAKLYSRNMTIFIKKEVGQFIPMGMFKNSENIVLFIGTKEKKFYAILYNFSSSKITQEEITQEEIVQIKKNI